MVGRYGERIRLMEKELPLFSLCLKKTYQLCHVSTIGPDSDSTADYKIIHG